MDIRSLLNIGKPSLDKTNRSEQANRSSKSEESNKSAGKTEAGKSSVQDNLQLSGTTPSDEMEFARSEMQKLNSESRSYLLQVKQRIEQGAYDAQPVHENISSKLIGDLSDAESTSVQQSEGAEKASSSNIQDTVTPEMREKLLNNKNVLDQLAGRILDDIANI